jgi:adenylate kinase family enzyme
MDLGSRIMVMGSSGSGKSTMAQRLGEITGLPVVHIDHLLWQPGWVSVPKEEVCARAVAAADQPEWIFDGNHAKTRDYRLERADTVIYLDFSRYTCICRVIRRWIQYYGKTRPDVTQGCPEKIDWEFIKLVWSYPRRRRAVLDWLSKIEPPKRVVHLRGNRAVRDFLRSL